MADEPKRLIGDKAYDSDAGLAKRGIEMIYRSNHIAKMQNSVALRRYKRRWKTEHMNSWLLSCRCVNERKVENRCI